MNMNKLMRPSSVVVIGATDKKGMAGGATQSSVKGVNKNRVYYLNPRREEIHGRKCYHALSELPEIPDCMLVCTPARTVAGYMEEAGRMGIGAAVVLASGFSEERTETARALSEELKAICLEYDMALCGPNCIGIVNGIDNICVTANNDITMTMLADDSRRGVGVIAQSGYISSGFNNPDCDYLACVVSAGNSIICGLEDYMLYMAAEERINCIAAYIEGITKPDILVKALKLAARNHKPVVALKAGSSIKGGFAAASHTGSMAGNHQIAESILRRFGVIITNNLEELVSTARMFAVLDGNLPIIPSMAGINFSGGENTLCADTCERFSISLPDFSENTLDVIRSIVPSFATAANPLDATTSLFSEKELVRKLFLAASEDPSIGLIAVGNDVGLHSEPKDITCAEVLSRMRREDLLKPAVVIPSFEKARNDDVRKTFEQAGIPVLSTGIYAYLAIRHLMEFVSFHPENTTLDLAIPSSRNMCTVKKRPLSEPASKEILKEAGIPVPGQYPVGSEAELEKLLINAGDHSFPFPWVMKVISDDIPHKTDAGGVELNIYSAADARDAYVRILQNCRKYDPDAQIDGVLIQEQLPFGQEILIGVICDPLFGPSLLCGMGGIQAELFQDTVLSPCPLSKQDALNMLGSLKIWPLFEGYRKAAPLDADALASLMVKVSDYACAHRNDLAELDLNPVFVYEKGQGAFAADALLILYEDDVQEV